jgi:stage III sporulation protein AE
MDKIGYRFVTAALMSLLLLLAISPRAAAETDSVTPAPPAVETEAVTMPQSYAELENAIPEELAGMLPDGLFSTELPEAMNAAAELTDWRYLLNAVATAVGFRAQSLGGLLCTLVGLVLLSAVCGRLKEGLGGSTGELFSACLRLAVYTAIILQTAGMVESVTRYFSELNTLTAGMIPVMGMLYALGGNLGQAAVTSELLTAFLALCGYVSSSVTPPICGICMAFTLTDALGSRMTLSPLSEQIKRWYTSLLGLMMFLFSLALSAQSVLTGRGDSLAMRGIKYAVGSMIPVVGGAVAGSLSTVAEGVSALRGLCGVAGIILVGLLLLPTLVELLLTRAVIRLAATVSSMLSCDGEAKLLGEIASLYGYLAAAVSVSAVTFLTALGILLRSGVAVG